MESYEEYMEKYNKIEKIDLYKINFHALITEGGFFYHIKNQEEVETIFKLNKDKLIQVNNITEMITYDKLLYHIWFPSWIFTKITHDETSEEGTRYMIVLTENFLKAEIEAARKIFDIIK
jgi:hypothetical protein